MVLLKNLYFSCGCWYVRDGKGMPQTFLLIPGAFPVWSASITHGFYLVQLVFRACALPVLFFCVAYAGFIWACAEGLLFL